MGSYGSIQYMTTWNKTFLGRANNFFKEGFKAVHQDFREDLVNGIAEASGSEISH